jgi:hypothetical protein
MTQATPGNESTKPAGSAEAPKKKSLVNKILIGLGALVGVVVLFVLLLPTLLSTSPGKNFILGYVNDAIAGKVEVDSISLGWFSGQTITGVKVTDPTGQTVATVAKIDMPSVRPTTFLDLSNDLGTITIDKPELSVVKNADGTTNLDAAFAPKAPAAKGSGTSGSGTSGGATKIVGPKGVVQVNGLVVTAKGFAPQTATVNVSTLTVDAKDLGKLGLAMKGDAAYGNDKGLLGADLVVSGLITPAGDLAPESAKVVGTVEARKLPVAVADAMANQGGLLVSLLGKEINIGLKADISQKEGEAGLKVDSENLVIEISIAKQGDGFALGKGPNSVKFAIKKDAVNGLLKEKQAPATMKKDVDVALVIKSLALPMTGGNVDINKLKLTAQLTASDVLLDVTANNIGTFEWKGTKLDVEIPEALEKEAKVTLTGGSASTGGVNAVVSVKTPQTTPVIAADVKVDNIPINVADALAKQDGKLVALLGEKLELVRVQVSLNADKAGSASLAIKSGNLNGGIYTNIKPTGVALDEGQKNSIGLVLSPAAFAKVSGPSPSMTLKKPLTVDLNVKAFTLPMVDGAPVTDKLALDGELVLGDIAAEIPGKPAINWARTTVSAQTKALGESVAVKVVGGSTSTGKLDVKVDVAKPMLDTRTIAADGELTQFPVALADALALQEGKLVALLGDTLELVKVKAALNADQTGKGSLAIKSANLNGGVAIAKKTDAVALESGQANALSLKISPAAFAKLMGPDPAMTLSQPLTVDAAFKALNLPMKDGSPVIEKLALDLEVVLGDVAAQVPGKPGFNWAKTTASVKTAELGEALAVVVNGGSSSTGKLDLKATVTKPMLETRVVKAAGELTQFPVGMADAFAGQDGKLTSLIGAQIKSLKFGADVEPGKPIRGTLDMAADQMEAKLGVTVDTAAKLATIDSGNYAKLTLTPAGAAKLFPAQPVPTPKPGEAALVDQRFVVTEPIELRLDLAKLQVAWKSVKAKVAAAAVPGSAKTTATDATAPDATAMALDTDRTAMDIKVSHDKGNLKMTRTGENLKLGAGSYQIKSANPAKEITIEGKSAFQGVKEGAKIGAGEFKVEKLVVKNLPFEGFAPVTKNFDAEAVLSGKNVPVEAVDTYMGKQGQYSTLLGTDLDITAGLKPGFHLDGTGLAEMTGPVYTTMLTRISGQQVATADLAGDLKGGRYTANKDNAVSIMMTPELSKQFLEKIAPVIQAVAGDKPSVVTLRKGYALVLSPFDMKSLTGVINVDLGTLKLTKGSALTSLFTTMAKFYAPAQKMVDSDYAAQFSPVDVKTAGGKASYTGMNLTTGPAQLAFDGDLDYANNVIDNMTIHVKGETFKDVKSLANTIKPGETVKIKVTGPLNKPKLDFGDLIGFGAKAAAGNLLKGETGEKIGGFLDAIGGKKEEPKKEEAAPKDGAKKQEPAKKDDVGGLINEGINLFGKKKEPAPATQPKK